VRARRFEAETPQERMDEVITGLLANGWEALKLWKPTEPPPTPVKGFAAVKMGIRNVGARVVELLSNKARDEDDLNFGRSSKRPSIFIYIQRGGATPLTGIKLLPFHSYVGGYSKTDLMVHETVQRVRDKKGPAELVSCIAVASIAAPTGCSIKDCIHKNTTRVRTTGFRARLFRLLTHGTAAADSTELSVYHRFETVCNGDGVSYAVRDWGRVYDVRGLLRTPLASEPSAPFVCTLAPRTHTRSRRPSQSPSEGTTGESSIIVQPWLWVQRRFIYPPLPPLDTADPSESMCRSDASFRPPQSVMPFEVPA